MNWVTLIPAYGRDYKSKKEIMLDWMSNKDFQLGTTRQYCNRQSEWPKGTVIMVRYRKLTMITEVEKF